MFVSHPPNAYDLFLTAAVADGIKLWDLRTNRCVRRYDGHVNRSQPIGVAISPCARFIATGSEDRSVCRERHKLLQKTPKSWPKIAHFFLQRLFVFR